jgi:hypothetical protein
MHKMKIHHIWNSDEIEEEVEEEERTTTSPADKVQIKFPKTAKTGSAAADKATTNGDVNSNNVVPVPVKSTNGHLDCDIIKISGTKEDCEAAAKALQDLVPIHIEVIYQFYKAAAFFNIHSTHHAEGLTQLASHSKTITVFR